MPDESAVTVVTIAHGRHDHLVRQREVLREVAAGVPHVVVAMEDPEIGRLLEGDPDVVLREVPADALGLPLAAARNLGVATAIDEGAELVVLLDVDCLPGPDLLRRYAEAARAAPGDMLCGPVTYLAAGVRPTRAAELTALTSPHPARPAPPDDQVVRTADHDLFWSLSFAVTPATWARVGGFCEEYVGYGGEDTDLAWSARDRGVGLCWVGGAHAYHQWHPVSAPPVEHLQDIVRNARIAHRRWGRWPMSGWLTAFAERGLIRWEGNDVKVLRDPPSPD
ncbi:glycosyltransferase [Marihabitans asiaticum]|uniref:GT2 family glycosyltransferase n=1 Tax=Marihabitans asiaticum TaxID=415218 RepID=A0A560WH80_9MICO|nr:galactosyltransferase-related protein [Marihabitans asiaticum]TWD17043.1 GT2 family glycosyltransferase [Marihabitans asiaticum]